MVLFGNHSRQLASLVGAWYGIVDVHQDAIIWDELRLPAYYRRWKELYTHSWSDPVRLERCIRLRLGVFDNCHRPKVSIIAGDALLFKCIRIPEWWQQWDVPQEI